jgi:hypothetical protein
MWNRKCDIYCEHNANNRNHRSSAAGTPSRNPASCNSPPVLRVSPSTVSRISKVPTDPVASRSRSRAKNRNSPSRIRASTAWICLPTRPTKCSRRSSPGPSRRRSASDRSREGGVPELPRERKQAVKSRTSLVFFAKPASLVACTYVCGIELLGRTVKTNRMEKTRNIVSHFLSLKEPGGHLFIHFDIMSLGGGFLPVTVRGSIGQDKTRHACTYSKTYLSLSIRLKDIPVFLRTED